MAPLWERMQLITREANSNLNRMQIGILIFKTWEMMHLLGRDTLVYIKALSSLWERSKIWEEFLCNCNSSFVFGKCFAHLNSL